MDAKKMTRSDILFVRSLADRKARSQHRLFLVEGEKNVAEVCRSGLRIHSVYAEDGWDTGWLDGLPVRPEFFAVSAQELGRISQQKTPNRVLAVVCMPPDRFRPEDLKGSLSILLDHVQDPGNMGTILRLADWFGIDHVLCSSDTVDVWSPKVVQATMGAISRVRVHYGDTAAFLDMAAALELPVYGTFLDGEDIYTQPLTPDGIIVMGNESQGISEAARRRIRHKLWLPCYPPGAPRSESLNVAVATALVCGEFRRRCL